MSPTEAALVAWHAVIRDSKRDYLSHPCEPHTKGLFWTILPGDPDRARLTLGISGPVLATADLPPHRERGVMWLNVEPVATPQATARPALEGSSTSETAPSGPPIAGNAGYRKGGGGHGE